MEKQYTKAVKDYLVACVSDETSIPEALVDSVVMWCYKDARDATANNSSVELSGYGTLLVSPTKLKKRMAKFQKMDGYIDRQLESCTEGMKEHWAKKKASCTITLQLIKRKYEQNGIEFEPDSGGLSQPPISKGEYEGSDRDNIEGTPSQMPELPV